MKMTSYIYTGPRSAVSLRHEKKVLDIALVPDAVVELPADHPYTATLIALGHIRLAPQAAKVPTKKGAK